MDLMKMNITLKKLEDTLKIKLNSNHHLGSISLKPYISYESADSFTVTIHSEHAEMKDYKGVYTYRHNTNKETSNIFDNEVNSHIRKIIHNEVLNQKQEI